MASPTDSSQQQQQQQKNNEKTKKNQKKKGKKKFSALVIALVPAPFNPLDGTQPLFDLVLPSFT